MAKMGKYSGSKPSAKDCGAQKSGANTFNSPKKRPAGPKSGATVVKTMNSMPRK